MENVIKLGRKIVDSESASTPDPEQLTAKIDSLKADFNEVGAQITEAKKVLERALVLSETLQDHLSTVQDWFGLTDAELAAGGKTDTGEEESFLRSKHETMASMKERVKSVQAIQEEFFELGNPKLLTGLTEYVRAVESRWSRTVARLQKRLNKINEELGSSAVDVPDFDLLNLSASRERTISTGHDSEDPMLTGNDIKIFLFDFCPYSWIFTEFRSAFREVSSFIKTAEEMLDAKQVTQAQDKELGDRIKEWRRKKEELGKLSERIVDKFVSQKEDVEPGKCCHGGG